MSVTKGLSFPMFVNPIGHQFVPWIPEVISKADVKWRATTANEIERATTAHITGCITVKKEEVEEDEEPESVVPSTETSRSSPPRLPSPPTSSLSSEFNIWDDERLFKGQLTLFDLGISDDVYSDDVNTVPFLEEEEQKEQKSPVIRDTMLNQYVLGDSPPPKQEIPLPDFEDDVLVNPMKVAPPLAFDNAWSSISHLMVADKMSQWLAADKYLTPPTTPPETLDAAPKKKKQQRVESADDDCDYDGGLPFFGNLSPTLDLLNAAIEDVDPSVMDKDLVDYLERDTAAVEDEDSDCPFLEEHEEKERDRLSRTKRMAPSEEEEQEEDEEDEDYTALFAAFSAPLADINRSEKGKKRKAPSKRGRKRKAAKMCSVVQEVTPAPPTGSNCQTESDHSYHKDRNASMVTYVYAETPSSSDSEIDVVSIPRGSFTRRPPAKGVKAAKRMRAQKKISRELRQQQKLELAEQQELLRDAEVALSRGTIRGGREGLRTARATVSTINLLSAEDVTIATDFTGTRYIRAGTARGKPTPRYLVSGTARGKPKGGSYLGAGTARGKPKGGITKKRKRGKNAGEDLAPSEKRDLHNNMERQRRIDLRKLYEILRKLVPSVACKERAPKVEILNHATSYIHEVQDTQAILLSEKEQMQLQQAVLMSRLSQLRLDKFVGLDISKCN